MYNLLKILFLVIFVFNKNIDYENNKSVDTSYLIMKKVSLVLFFFIKNLQMLFNDSDKFLNILSFFPCTLQFIDFLFYFKF